MTKPTTLVIIAVALLSKATVAPAEMAPAGGFGPGFAAGLAPPLAGPGFIDVDVGVAYTDNAVFDPTKVSDTLGMAGVEMNYNRQGSKLSLAAVGNLNWLQYLHNTFPGEPYGTFDTTASWGKTTDVFQWLLTDNFGEGLNDPLEAPSLGNLEYINYLTTGPQFNFNFSAQNLLGVHALYSKTTFQNSPFDSDTYDGGAVLTHRLSTSSSVSLDLDDARTRMNSPGLAPDYSIRTAALTYQSAFQRTQVSVTAGYTIASYMSTDNGAPSFALSVTRRVSPFSNVQLSAQTGYLTLGQSMMSNMGAPISASVLSGATQNTSSPLPFKNSLASIGWYYQRSRTTVSLAVSAAKQRYPQVAPQGNDNQLVTLDEPPMRLNEIGARQIRPIGFQSLDISNEIDSTYETASALLARQLRPTVSLSLQGYLTSYRLDNLHARTTFETYYLTLSKQLRKTAVVLYIERTQQTASGAYSGLANGAFNSNTVGLFVTYDLVGARFARKQ